MYSVSFGMLTDLIRNLKHLFILKKKKKTTKLKDILVGTINNVKSNYVNKVNKSNALNFCTYFSNMC